MRILLCGGGTGGHVFPLAALVEEIRGERGLLNNSSTPGIPLATLRVGPPPPPTTAPPPAIATAPSRSLAECPVPRIFFQQSQFHLAWVGCAESLEEKIAHDLGVPFHAVAAGRLVRRFSGELMVAPFRFLQGFFQSLKILGSLNPEWVVSSASYVSAPVLLAAVVRRIPILLLEQNVRAGLTNRFFGRLAHFVVVTFPETCAYFSSGRCLVLGNPVRRSVRSSSRADAVQYLGLNPLKKTIVFTGGSQGARFINDLARRIVPKLLAQNFQIVQLVGEPEHAKVLTSWGERIPMGLTVRPFEDQVGFVLAAADVVVSRAGATWIAEVLTRAIPSILIPYPYASENHQRANAEVVARTGAGYMLEQANLRDEEVIAIIKRVLSDAVLKRSIQENCSRLSKPNASRDVVSLLFRK